MKSKKVLVCLCLLSIMTQLAYAQTLEWAKQLGGTGSDEGNSIAVDDPGNVYTTGSFEGTVDFDPGTNIFNLTSAGRRDVFITKFDASGNFVWAKQLGGIDADVANSIAVDAVGNVYTTGSFSGTADFDPGISTFNLTSVGINDIYISKLDASGNFVWAKQIGGIEGDMGKSVAVDTSGNVYATGRFQDIVDFNPGNDTFNLTSVGFSDVFILKLDASGNFVWAKQIGGLESDEGNSLTVDFSGNIYTTGFFAGTADFGPGISTFNLTSVGLNDIYISKLGASGNFVWAKQIGGTGFEEGNSITTDAAGKIYTTGRFQGTVDFDPGVGIFNLISTGNENTYISKFDELGNLVWAKQTKGSSSFSNSITIDVSGSVYTVGSFFGIVDFSLGFDTFNLYSAGNTDIFIIKLDASGNFVWAKQIGGMDFDNGNSIAVASGYIYTTGGFQDTVDFNPGNSTFNLSSAGGRDIFVLKLADVITSSIDKQNLVVSALYPNPSSGVVTINLGNATEEISYSIFSIEGKAISSGTTRTNTITIDLSAESNGIYFVKLIAANSTSVHKLIKQ